jgi:hypothetical protein
VRMLWWLPKWPPARHHCSTPRPRDSGRSGGPDNSWAGHMAGGQTEEWSRYTTWVCPWLVRKTIRFWQKHSPNCDFWSFHCTFTLCTSKNI